MARSVNKVILIGNLGSDPDRKMTPSGTPVANVNIATTEQWTNKDGSKASRTEWHRLVFWRQLADIVTQYAHKGSKLYIEGSIRNRDWTDDNGVKRYVTEVEVREMVLLDSNPNSNGNGNGHAVPVGETFSDDATSFDPESFEDEELPDVDFA